ncbi:GH3 auxin-responsive promoter [Scleroderma citrinum]
MNIVADRLKERTEGTLVNLIKQNKDTRYACESPAFSCFRSALSAHGHPGDEVQDDMLLESYRTSIPLTTYDSYEPFVNKFFDPNCKESDVKDMFSPGLPYFIATSSATAGKTAKFFPKYRHAEGGSYKSVDSNANPTSDTGGKNCIVYSLNYQQLIDVQNEDGDAVKKIPVTIMSAGSIRMQNNIDVEKDPHILHLTAPRASSPMAVCFIRHYRSFLLMHVLFALAEPKLENITTLFGTVFVDMLRYMEEEWDALLDSIETGKIPDWEGINHVLHYLEPKFPPRPERAAYLRTIGKANQEVGWIVRIWPTLKVVVGIASGVFSAVIPKMRHYLGPDVQMRSLGFTASEAYIGTVYDPSNLNLFKVASDDVIEYLDVLKEENTEGVMSAWQVESGQRYEIVLTTRDGLWKYRMGDVIEIAGFDPEDGAPIVRYVERRNVGLRLGRALASEKQLADAIFAAQDALGPIIEFTVVVDDRVMPPRLGYLVEVQGELGPDADEAPAQVLLNLGMSNVNIKDSVEIRAMGPPTVRIVRPGTFRDYRQRKIEATGGSAGQTKVPVVIWDTATQEWMFEQVEREVGILHGF